MARYTSCNIHTTVALNNRAASCEMTDIRTKDVSDYKLCEQQAIPNIRRCVAGISGVRLTVCCWRQAHLNLSAFCSPITILYSLARRVKSRPRLLHVWSCLVDEASVSSIYMHTQTYAQTCQCVALLCACRQYKIQSVHQRWTERHSHTHRRIVCC